MSLEIKFSRLGPSQNDHRSIDVPELQLRAERWHPALRTLIIVGAAGSLWAGLLAALA